jgi:glucose/arabinose dehydrogenase
MQQQLLNQYFAGALQQQQQQQQQAQQLQQLAQMPLTAQGANAAAAMAGAAPGYTTAYLPNGQAILVPNNQVMQMTPPGVPGAGGPAGVAARPQMPIGPAGAAMGLDPALAAARALLGGALPGPAGGGGAPQQFYQSGIDAAGRGMF